MPSLVLFVRTTATLALSSFAIMACHSTPAATPTPVTRVANVDNGARARAQADSLARAAARRDSLARKARLDSIERANAAARAAGEAARASLLAAIHFDFNRAEIRADDRATLDKKAALLVANPTLQIRIDGNADDRGSDEYNLALGMKRAAEVRRYLAQHGVDTTRAAIDSYGEERPVCQENDESCWSRNRRDEFVIVAGGERIVAVP